MQSKKYYTSLIIAVVLFLGSLIAFVVFRYINRRAKEKVAETKLNEEIVNSDVTDRQRIINGYTEIKDGLTEKGVTDENFIRLVVAQASFESNRFDSAVYIGNNNAFGMRHPSVRPTTSLGDTNKDGYANYNSLRESAIDYYLWTEYNHLPVSYGGHEYKNIQDFCGKLKAKGYFEDNITHYIKGVNACMNELKNILNQG